VAAAAAMLPGSIVARASGDRVTALAASKRVKKTQWLQKSLADLP